ncbi:MAG: DUF2318 domain-containing protein [Parasporobacterium sp.]|nr:DUF2318 domain-containing protein [Parasporobacterium sp.]
MLKYLVDATLQLVAMMIIVGMILGFVRNYFGDKPGKLIQIAVLAGVLCAAAMAVMKTVTNKIDTGGWNLWFYYISLGCFLLFLVSTVLFCRKKVLHSLIPCIFLGVIIVIQMVYALADFFVYPHTIMLTEDSLLSTNFLTKMSGALVGLIVTLIVGFSANAVAKALKRGESLFFLCLILITVSCRQVAASFSTLLTRRIIPNNHTLFQIAKFSSNHSSLFKYICLGILMAAAILLLIRSLRENEPYSNPAQRRKIIFKYRMIRRWSTTALIFSVICILMMTVIYGIANREVELSPIEDCEIENGALVIPFEMVDDGHLHRFGYETDNGVVIRVIVIQKPNSSSYGIGLDACDICGETGYYEKDGQVVCNLCDVVMNINTIGFKGGCNPIVIDYTIENGRILIPVEGLMEYESEFK